MPSTRPIRIALLIDTSVTFSSLVIQGVARYARQRPNWQLLLQPRGVREHRVTLADALYTAVDNESPDHGCGHATS